MTTFKNGPPSVIMQDYLTSHDTTQHFIWLYIIPMNNMLPAICETAHMKRHDGTAIRKLEFKKNELVANPSTPRDATAQFSSI